MPELIKKVGAVLRKVVYKLPAYSPKIWLDEVPAANPPGAISVHVAFGHYFKEVSEIKRHRLKILSNLFRGADAEFLEWGNGTY